MNKSHANRLESLVKNADIETLYDDYVSMADSIAEMVDANDLLSFVEDLLKDVDDSSCMIIRLNYFTVFNINSIP